jgi:hypothetical protein
MSFYFLAVLDNFASSFFTVGIADMAETRRLSCGATVEPLVHQYLQLFLWQRLLLLV